MSDVYDAKGKRVKRLERCEEEPYLFNDSEIHEICLIDSENVGMDIVNEILRQHRVETEICYFQSVCSPTLKIIPMTEYDWKTVTVKLFGCECGTNAMDFQILAYIFCRVFKNNKKPEKYIIISRDHGYDPAIKLLLTAGIDVQRIAPSMKHNGNTNTSKKLETGKKNLRQTECETTHNVVPTGNLISSTPDIDKALQSAIGNNQVAVVEDNTHLGSNSINGASSQLTKGEETSDEKTETAAMSALDEMYEASALDEMYEADNEVDEAAIRLARIRTLQDSDSVGTDTSDKKNAGKTDAIKTKGKNKKQTIVLTSKEKQIKNDLLNKQFTKDQATGIARAFGNSKNLNKLAVELPKYIDADSMRKLYAVTTKSQRKKWCTMTS